VRRFEPVPHQAYMSMPIRAPPSVINMWTLRPTTEHVDTPAGKRACGAPTCSMCCHVVVLWELFQQCVGDAVQHIVLYPVQDPIQGLVQVLHCKRRHVWANSLLRERTNSLSLITPQHTALSLQLYFFFVFYLRWCKRYFYNSWYRCPSPPFSHPRKW
jgi:hypothetical protein